MFADDNKDISVNWGIHTEDMAKINDEPRMIKLTLFYVLFFFFFNQSVDWFNDEMSLHLSLSIETSFNSYCFI